MLLYADTSVLISYYVSDANSARAQALIHGSSFPLLFTGLHRLELRNALALAVFRRVITPNQARNAWTDIQRDCRARRYAMTPVKWVPVLRHAAQIAARHTHTIGSRSLDVLHTAAASRLDTDEFWSFDARQRTLATALGLTVRP